MSVRAAPTRTTFGTDSAPEGARAPALEAIDPEGTERCCEVRQALVSAGPTHLLSTVKAAPGWQQVALGRGECAWAAHTSGRATGSWSLTRVSPLQASATRKRGSRGRRPTLASTGRWATRPSRSSTPQRGRTSWAVRPACVSTPCTVAGCVCTARYRPLLPTAPPPCSHPTPQPPPLTPRAVRTATPQPSGVFSSSLSVWPRIPPVQPPPQLSHPEEGEPGLPKPLEGSGPVSCWRAESISPDKFSSGRRAFSWFPFVSRGGCLLQSGWCPRHGRVGKSHQVRALVLQGGRLGWGTCSAFTLTICTNTSQAAVGAAPPSPPRDEVAGRCWVVNV